MSKLEESKKKALENYKKAKQAYIDNMSSENWIAYCDTKTECMRLGVRI